MRGEIKRRAINISTRDEDVRFSRRVNFAGEDAVGTDAPVLRTTVLFEQLQPPSTPGMVPRDAQALSNDAIDFGPKQELVHGKLLARSQKRRGFVANLQNGGARHGLFVILDLVLYVQLVLVLERARYVLRHGVGQGGRCCSQVFKLDDLTAPASVNYGKLNCDQYLRRRH